MPLGIQRLNVRHQQPNSRIIFIKPLSGPTSAYAQDFLERIAAICQPIMKSHHLSIMTLEEYEPNREFVGRNFNAGEIIQLVLRAPYTGHWLPFRSVQMVMMHELAHCVEMNHSGAFWKARNLYAEDLRELWRKGYTGDGFWGKGKTVLSAEYENTGSMEAEVMAEKVCGGTFRSGRGRKRKRRGGPAADGSSLTYAERQQKRIAKKFGVNGVALGDDVETRVKLENGKKPKGKPKVAGSARGRELRVAAALARFTGQKEEETKKEEEEEEQEKEKEKERESGSETDNDYEDWGIKHEDAWDLDGSRLLDSKGNSMVKVCEGEDQDDIHVKNEMCELQNLNDLPYHPSSPSSPKLEVDQPPSHIKVEQDPSTTAISSPSSSTPRLPPPPISAQSPPTPSPAGPPYPSPNLPHDPPPRPYLTLPIPTQSSKPTCPICTTINSPGTLVCDVCAHVLGTGKVAGWRCQSESCGESGYVNAGDCGVCGICGGRRGVEL